MKPEIHLVLFGHKFIEKMLMNMFILVSVDPTAGG
jgi:hypothetical protein